MWVLDLLVGLLIVLVITAFTGYFVAQEFGYMSVDRSRLSARAAKGDAAAERALGITRRTSFMLSGAQLGITITALLVGYVAEPFIGSAIEEALGGVDVPASVGLAIGTAVALVASTFIQMLFGELFPKNLAIARPEPVALWLARSTGIYLGVFGWLIKIFDAASNALLRAFKMEPVHDVEHAATARDLEHIVADSRDSGDLPEELSVLLDRVLDFPEEDVEHAMVPRSRVDTVDPDDTVAELWQVMSTGHSRYPVLDEDDEVVGVVHLQDVLVAGHDSPLSARDLMREPVMVATLMALPDALRTMAAEKAQMAIVLDEYGGYDGVLTAEDLAEELVGEIEDEHDPRVEEEVPATDGSWTLSGDLHVDEVERTIGRDLPTGDFETIGGLVIAAYGGLPEVGDTVEVELPLDPSTLLDEGERVPEHLHLEVLEIERHVPGRVRATLPVRPDPSEQLLEELRTGEEIR